MENSVTIIIPTYNRNSLLNEVLPSYLNQECVAEILIVDDGSKTPVAESLSASLLKNNQIRIVRHYRSLGSCAARNTGILEAKTEFVFFGEDDLTLCDNHIVNLLKAKNELNADLICGIVINQKHDEPLEEAIKILPKSKDVFNHRFISINFYNITKPMELPFAHAIFLAPTDLLKKYLFNYRIGGPSFRREDIEIQLFFRSQGYKIFIVPNILSLHLSKVKGYGGGTRIKLPLLIHLFSNFVNTWQVINNNYNIIAPFFNDMPYKTMMRRSLFWLTYLESKRWLQANLICFDRFLNKYNQYIIQKRS